MKSIKRTFCVVLAVLMLLGTVVISASAADTDKAKTGVDNKIYFDANGWKNVTSIYCHIWKRGADSFYAWQSKKELCASEGGTLYSYDIDKLGQSTTVSGGIQSDQDYCIIFSANTGLQTYDLTFGRACIGDTAKLSDGKKVENPVDSEKRADEAVWTNNGSKFGPHLSLTSIGNIVGQFLCPNEKGTEVIGDWLPTYYNSQFVKPVKALTNAFPKFGIKTEADLKAIKKYIAKKQTGGDETAMNKILDEAFIKSHKSNTIKVTAVNKAYKASNLKKKAMSYKAVKVSKAQGKVTYKVTKSNKNLTFKSGKITVKKSTKKGTYKITVAVTAAGNSTYAKKTITTSVKVTVK